MKLAHNRYRGGVTDDRRDPRWTPMLVTAHLVEPIMTYGDGIYLDGALSGAAFAEYEGSLPDPQTAEWVEDFDLPLAIWTAPIPAGERVHPRLLTPSGEVWGWCCSAAVYRIALAGRHEVRKRPAVDQMTRLSDDARFQGNLGHMKAYDLVFPTICPEGMAVWWYALGDPDGVRRLLARVPALGKKRGQGMGVVTRWEVETAEADWSITGHDGALMRRMPILAAATEIHRTARRTSIRAPYWHSSRRCLCVEPDHVG